MKKDSLKLFLLSYIDANEGWHNKGQLYAIGDEEGYSPEYVGRELRALAEENKIQVSYYKSKRNIELARYSRLGESIPKPVVPKIQIVERDGKMVAIYA